MGYFAKALLSLAIILNSGSLFASTCIIKTKAETHDRRLIEKSFKIKAKSKKKCQKISRVHKRNHEPAFIKKKSVSWKWVKK